MQCSSQDSNLAVIQWRVLQRSREHNTIQWRARAHLPVYSGEQYNNLESTPNLKQWRAVQLSIDHTSCYTVERRTIVKRAHQLEYSGEQLFYSREQGSSLESTVTVIQCRAIHQYREHTNCNTEESMDVF